jgi:hypothetical protein
VAQVEWARLHIARSDYDAAEKQVDVAIVTIKIARAKTPGDLNLILLAANADIVGGQIAASRKDRIAARDRWEQARDAVAPIARVGDDPNVLATWTTALLLLNDLGEARPLLQKLAAMGYRSRDLDALLAAKKLPYVANADVVRRITADLITKAW